MKRKNATRSALFTSVISMLLCISMLVGTTFAWFTDSVTSANNIIKSGKLDVEMYWADGTEAVPADDSTDWADASTGAIFNSTLWEPGYTEVRHIKIANEGTLALKYQLQIKANGEVSKLAEVIDVYFADPATTTDRAMTGMTRIGTLKEVLAGMPANVSGVLAADKDAKVTIALKMQESAGNEYQELAIGSDFSIVLVATQLTAELDSFDNQYDKDSQYPVLSNKDKEDNKDATVGAEGVEINIPAAAPAGNYSIEVSNKSETTDAAGNTTVAMDITLKKDGVKVEADGSIAYTVSVDIGAGLKLTKLTHNGAEIDDYDYNFTSGIVTFTTTHFSPFSFTYKDNGFVAAIEKTGYATLAAAIEAAKDGKTVTLLKDIAIDADETITIAADKKVTLDLNGYTLSGVSDDADKNDDGKLTSADNEVMFDVRGTLTVKNGTITMKHTSDNLGWNGCTEIFYVGFNGTLNVENATLENLGGSDMAYAIDLVNADGTGTGITVNVKDSTLKSTYIPFRVFNNGAGMNNVTIKNSKIAGVSRALWVHIYSSKDNGGKGIKDATLNLDIFGNGNTYTASNLDRIIEFGFDDEINFDSNGYQLVSTADELKAALAAGRNVILAAGTYSFPASSMTKDTVLKCEEGVVFNGVSGMNINGATVIGATFDAAGNTNDGTGAGTGTINGTFKNCTFTGNHALRYCYAGETVVFENCVFNGDVRGIHFDDGANDVYFKNCTIYGFNAIGEGVTKAVFENCTFGNGRTGYNGLNLYTNTELINCKFEYNTGKTNFIDMEGTGKTLTIENCTATLDGVTANVADFVGGSKLAQNTVNYK